MGKQCCVVVFWCLISGFAFSLAMRSVDAQVTRLDDPGQLGEDARFVYFGNSGGYLGPQGRAGDFGSLFERWGIRFRAFGGNRLELGCFAVFGPGLQPPGVFYELRHVPISAETDGPLSIDLGRAASKVILTIETDSQSVLLSAFTLDGDLLGSVQPVGGNPSSTFAGVATTDPRGIGMLVLRYEEPDPIERVSGLTVEYLEASNFTAFLPQAGFGSTGEIALDTEIRLANLSNQDSDATVFLVRSDGSALTTPLADNGRRSFHLRPFESISFLLSAGTSLESAVQVGYARIESSQPIDATAVYTTFGASGSSIGEAGVGSTNTQFLANGNAEKNAALALNTGLAVVNPNAESVTISLTAFDAETVVRMSTALEPGRQVALFLDDLFPELRDRDFKGTLILRSDGPVAAVQLRTREGVASASVPLGGLLLPGIH